MLASARYDDDYDDDCNFRNLLKLVVALLVAKSQVMMFRSIGLLVCMCQKSNLASCLYLLLFSC